MAVSEQLLYSVSGARGIVGKTIDVDVVTRLTLALCSILPDGEIVVGRDTRPSGESFTHSVIGAVTAAGRDCVDLGIATTPTVEMATEKLGAAGGIIITASHNPVEWNALKFLDHRGIFLTGEVSEELYKVFRSGRFSLADGKSAGQLKEYAPAADDHINSILALDIVDAALIRKRGFKVVLDCINGAGSVIAPSLLETLGVDVIGINCKSDGDFFRNPEPSPATLQELADKVKAEGADLGFACDPDADRLALVDNEGNAISEEYTLALAVDLVLSRKKGPVVINMSTSSVVEKVAQKHSIGVSRTPVGEINVVDRMLKDGAVIGGEGNGGVIYPELHPGRDAPLGMALILQMLAQNGVSLAEQVAAYPPFYITKEKVGLDGKFSPQVISRLIREKDPDTIDVQDGVKAYFDDGWIHLRISNTEGVVRVIAEASTKEKSLFHQKTAREILRSSWDKQ